MTRSRCPEVGLGSLDPSVLGETKRILEPKTRRNRTRKSVPPRPRKRANPDGSGRGKHPGFGGRQNLVTFQLKSYLKFHDFGPQQAPGPSGGFSGGPRRDVRRAARRDLQDDQQHDPKALVHRVFVLSRCLRFSFVSFFFVTSSSVRFLFASRGRIRFVVASNGRIRKFQFDLWTFSLDPVTSSVVAVVERQPSTLHARRRIVHAFKNPRATAAAARTRISHNSKPTSGHLKVKILNRPLDTSKSKF